MFLPSGRPVSTYTTSYSYSNSCPMSLSFWNVLCSSVHQPHQFPPHWIRTRVLFFFAFAIAAAICALPSAFSSYTGFGAGCAAAVFVWPAGTIGNAGVVCWANADDTANTPTPVTTQIRFLIADSLHVNQTQHSDNRTSTIRDRLPLLTNGP